ncbi:Uncharacterised protein [Mycobacteroides abscessus subsp. abscessus]|nr:Uncharacterised protein [Mycobacteroides abscessus subsp. abscessus]
MRLIPQYSAKITKPVAERMYHQPTPSLITLLSVSKASAAVPA